MLTTAAFAAGTAEQGTDGTGGTGDVLPLAASGMTAVDGAVYVADSYLRSIWRVADGEAEWVAGQTGITDIYGRPVSAYRDDVFAEAAFDEPWAIVPYLDGFLVSDAGNNALRYLDMEDGRVYTAAGTGDAGYADGNSMSAQFSLPTGLAAAEDGTVYIADTGNNVIRAIDGEGNVTTYAGAAGETGSALGSLETARFSEPTGLCYADGVLYVADSGNHRVVAIADGEVTLVAGGELAGDLVYSGDLLNGAAETAHFANPQGVAVSEDGTVYIADTGNGAVRAVKDGFVTTLIASGRESDLPVLPRGLLLAGDVLYIGDTFSRAIVSCGAEVEELRFDDLAEDDPNLDAVRFVCANGLFQGTGERTFEPEKQLTRAMIVTVLARLAGADTTPAEGENWYEAARLWAMERGVSDGTRMTDPVTREQFCTMLYRCAQTLGLGFSGVWAFELDYTDAADISEYAYEAVCWLTMNGMVQADADTDGAFEPGGAVSRMEAAAVFAKFVTMLHGA